MICHGCSKRAWALLCTKADTPVMTGPLDKTACWFGFERRKYAFWRFWNAHFRFMNASHANFSSYNIKMVTKSKNIKCQRYEYLPLSYPFEEADPRLSSKADSIPRPLTTQPSEHFDYEDRFQSFESDQTPFASACVPWRLRAFSTLTENYFLSLPRPRQNRPKKKHNMCHIWIRPRLNLKSSPEASRQVQKSP